MSKTTNNLDILTQLFSALSDQEKREFLSSVSNSVELTKVIQPKETTHCPYCQSEHFVKNGTQNNKQRFLCRKCKKSFVEQTGTVLSYTKKDLTVWEKYVNCMIEKYPLRKCAKVCNVSLQTAFYWRHKILDAL
jgi:transposase-like protein